MEKKTTIRVFGQGLVSSLANLGSLWIERTIRHSIEGSLLLTILQISAIMLTFSGLPSQVPLFYSRPWGEPQITSSQSLLYLPGLSLAVLILNNFLAVFFIKQEKFLSICLAWTSALFSLFCLITLVKIITVIT